MTKAVRVKWAKFRVTILAVAALVILFLLLYQLFGIAMLAPKTEVFLYVPDATGLSGESPIRVDGIDVGKVSAVELSGSKDRSRAVKVTLSLHRERLPSIPADSVVQISSDSLIGDKFVDITSGRSEKAISPDGELTYKDQPELMKSLDLTQFTQELRLVDATLTDIEQGRSQFGKFYQGTEFYNDLQRRLLDMQAGMRDATSTTSAVGSLLSTDQLHRQVSDMLTKVDQTIAKIQSGQGMAGGMLHDSTQYDQLLKQAQGFRKSIAALSSNDMVQSDAAYTGATKWVAAMIRSVDDLNLNPQLATTEMYDNLNGSLTKLRDTIQDFRLNPKKYLRLKVF